MSDAPIKWHCTGERGTRGDKPCKRRENCGRYIAAPLPSAESGGTTYPCVWFVRRNK